MPRLYPPAYFAWQFTGNGVSDPFLAPNSGFIRALQAWGSLGGGTLSVEISPDGVQYDASIASIPLGTQTVWANGVYTRFRMTGSTTLSALNPCNVAVH